MIFNQPKQPFGEHTLPPFSIPSVTTLELLQIHIPRPSKRCFALVLAADTPQPLGGIPTHPPPGASSSWNVPRRDRRGVLLQGRREQKRKAAQQRQEVVTKALCEGQRQQDNRLRLQSCSCLCVSACLWLPSVPGPGYRYCFINRTRPQLTS